MLKSCSQAACPACAAPYANVRSSSHIVGLKLTSVGMGTVFLCLSSIFITACAAFTWLVLCRKKHLSGASLGAVLGAAVMMTIVGLGLIILLIRLLVLRGLATIVETALLRELKVHVLATHTLPAEVVMPPLA